jgi:UDP-N-acetylmuramyl pentapeptide phosphotransferase/UDP-N-acetylglucosamine-1-phosphate transferase
MTIAALISFTLSALAVRILASERLLAHILDVPNERSLHETPVPRTGGIGLLLAAGSTWAVLSGWELAPLVSLAGALALLSLADDIKSLPVSVRFIAQWIAALVFLIVYGTAHWAALILLLPAIVWMTNLYNFMDGSDGLAGGMTAIGFGTYAAAASIAGAHDLALLSVSIAAAAAGFLLWNFPPARIFMGDTGSIPLGFLAAAVGAIGWQRAIWPWWFPALVFSPFIVDATVTLVARFLRGERIHEAHKSHYYQRINRMGLGHRGTALCEYVLMIVVAASALACRHLGPTDVTVLLVAWGAVYAALMYAIDRRWRAFDRFMAT